MRFLLIEDSAIVVKIIRHLIKPMADIQCDVAMSLAEAKQLLIKNQIDNPYLAAVVDLTLPDAPQGEAVDLCLSLKLPSLVLTGRMDEEIRSQMQQKPIVDYIIKESRYSYETAINILQRLDKNQNLEAMVVNPDEASRSVTKTQLERQLLTVSEAANGAQALKLLSDRPNISLVTIEHSLPDMTGPELARLIRRDDNNNRLLLIGISERENETASAQFIKNGANDHLPKPYSNEIFNSRIFLNIGTLERIQSIKHQAHTDFLTGIPNRRHFYEQGGQILEQAKESDLPLCLALINIDHFRQINDGHGHEVGDAVLVEFANTIAKAFSRFNFYRTAGEEFCLILNGLTLDKAYRLLEDFRSVIEDQIINLPHTSISITISVGLVQNNDYGLDQILRDVDQQLYVAKRNGRNQISCDQF